MTYPMKVGFDVCVYVTYDDCSLVFRGREVRVTDFELAQVGEFEVPFVLVVVQLSIECLTEGLELVFADINVETVEVLPSLLMKAHCRESRVDRRAAVARTRRAERRRQPRANAKATW